MACYRLAIFVVVLLFGAILGFSPAVAAPPVPPPSGGSANNTLRKENELRNTGSLRRLSGLGFIINPDSIAEGEQPREANKKREGWAVQSRVTEFTNPLEIPIDEESLDPEELWEIPIDEESLDLEKLAVATEDGLLSEEEFRKEWSKRVPLMKALSWVSFVILGILVLLPPTFLHFFSLLIISILRLMICKRWQAPGSIFSFFAIAVYLTFFIAVILSVCHDGGTRQTVATAQYMHKMLKVVCAMDGAVCSILPVLLLGSRWRNGWNKVQIALFIGFALPIVHTTMSLVALVKLGELAEMDVV